jgi:hypothetical protein
MGYKSLGAFLVGFWEAFFLERDVNNLLCMLWTWQNGNVGMTPGFGGDHEKALASIKVDVSIQDPVKYWLECSAPQHCVHSMLWMYSSVSMRPAFGRDHQKALVSKVCMSSSGLRRRSSNDQSIMCLDCRV